MPADFYTLPLEPLELTTVLLRHHGIHRGLWTLQVNFMTTGHNVVSAQEAGAFPAVLVGLKSVCLGRVETAHALSHPTRGFRSSDYSQHRHDRYPDVLTPLTDLFRQPQ